MKLSEIATKLGCKLEAGAQIEIERVAGIDDACPGDLTFVSNRKYISHLKSTRASAVILGLDMPEVPIPSLRTSNPYLAFAKALEFFFVPTISLPGVDSTAVIAPDATLGNNVHIGAFAVVGAGCILGADVILHPHVVLYPGVSIGDGTVLHAHVTIRENCRIGRRVLIQNGAIIGSDGFGFAPMEDGSYYKIPQTGMVIVEDNADIGANTTIDRAAVGNTVIHAGAKIDNLVQIGHGSSVGENSVLAAQVGLAGSTHVGKAVKVGGQVGLAGHLKVGDNAIITAQSGASHDIDPSAIMSGSPVTENATWLRYTVALPRLPDLLRRIRALEKEVNNLKMLEKSAK